MEEQPRKGPGRPRKALAVSNAAPEGENANHQDDGDGETRPAGGEPQANPARQDENWAQFHERIRVLTYQEPRIRNVWHPKPEHNLVIAENLSVNVFEGPYKGQLNTGEFIDI